MNLLAFLVAQLIAAASVLATTNLGTPCLAACSKWSATLSQCHTIYGISREYTTQTRCGQVSSVPSETGANMSSCL